MSLDLIVFQGTGGCNLNCTYCYLPEASRRSHRRLPEAVLAKAAGLIFRSSLLSGSPTVLWHAGEPLTVGHRTFRESLCVIDEANIHGRALIHSVQTNGTLVNQDWCDLFRAYGVKVGVSADGPPSIHDRNRVGWRGQGSHERMMRGVKALRENNIPYAGICVLSDFSLDYPDEIYDFFLDEGFATLGFNLEELEAANRSTSLTASSGTQERFRRFMTRLVERWLLDAGAMHIREFEHLASKYITQRTRTNFVAMQDVACGLKILTVRTDGSLITFSPELASGTESNPDAFVVGHIDHLDELEDIFSDERYLRFRREIRAGIAACRASCEYFKVCGGGWPSNKFFENGTFASAETMVCRLQVKTLGSVLQELFFSRPEFDEAVRQHTRSSMPAEV